MPSEPANPTPDRQTRPLAKLGVVGGLLARLFRWTMAGQSSAWLASALLHIATVLVLSLAIFGRPGQGPPNWLDGNLVETPNIDTLDLESDVSIAMSGGPSNSAAVGAAAIADRPGSSAIVSVDLPDFIPRVAAEETGATIFSAAETIANPLLSRGGGLQGRSAGNRRQLALEGGGTEASESAVELGLAWLAAHQWEDGGWRFDLQASPKCMGECRNSGNLESTTAPTGLALLCFLGAGYTQHEGPYQQVVADGLYYLTNQMILTSFGGDLRGSAMGTMYSHGIATLALTEAYAMTRDANLADPAQKAIDFIVHAQHENGGWRYAPGEPGDTTVSGWQIAALKSALLARLEVPYEVWHKISAFLDSVQLQRGAAYGYKGPTQSSTTTNAIGLFGRMILGWPRNHRPLLRGMAKIGEQKPRESHIYFNYYAAQILHHFGGPIWQRWNVRTREYLVKNQATQGHERGSWYFQEQHSSRGGRLYTTTMAIMTLEVYYRYMPLYQTEFVDTAP